MLIALKKALKENNITLRKLANEIKIPYSTLNDKITGRTEFSLKEAKLIHEKYFPNYSMYELFKDEQENF